MVSLINATVIVALKYDSEYGVYGEAVQNMEYVFHFRVLH